MIDMSKVKDEVDFNSYNQEKNEVLSLPNSELLSCSHIDNSLPWNQLKYRTSNVAEEILIYDPGGSNVAECFSSKCEMYSLEIIVYS